MSKPYLSPFVFNGRWWLKPYERQPTRELLTNTLEQLLQRHSPKSILLLRAMTVWERRYLSEARADCDGDVLSHFIARQRSKAK